MPSKAHVSCFAHILSFQHLDPERTGFVPLQELRDFLGDAPDGLLDEMEDLIEFAMVEGLVVEE